MQTVYILLYVSINQGERDEKCILNFSLFLVIISLSGCTPIIDDGVFTTANLQGTYAFKQIGGDISGSVGVCKFDGGGSVTCRGIHNDMAVPPELGGGFLFPVSVDGSYTMDSDGTGIITATLTSIAIPDLSFDFHVDFVIMERKYDFATEVFGIIQKIDHEVLSTIHLKRR